MRLLVVHAHPLPESFNAALCRAVVEVAAGAGHEVRAVDLQAENFDPVMSAEERRGYDGPSLPEDPDIRGSIKNLLWG